MDGTGAHASVPLRPGVWPTITNTMRPWAYWWWPGSAVDKTNISQLLSIYAEAGLGGLHIIPIYGVRGFEHKYLTYLSPAWLEMLDHTVRSARQTGLGVDMTLGTGWCFGGPRVSDSEANASLVLWSNTVSVNTATPSVPNPENLHALVAFDEQGRCTDLKDRLQPDGRLRWRPGTNTWVVYAIWQRPSGQKVKRAAPGGQGHMLNLIYRPAIENFLRWFDEAFASYTGAMPRAVYHDSYEYKSEWSPDLLSAFSNRFGYRLETHLPWFLGGPDPDRTARIKCDYRELVSDLIFTNLARWVEWAHARGFITRNEAHGSPGNILDFYAVADIPETEFFRSDRDVLVAKLASSAAHLTGRNLVSSESGTWLAEHFHETLHNLKYLMDDFFLAGVNHVFYHGTCYSPTDAPWPGWVFYASTQMNPQNSIWMHVRALNEYIARCQSILQSGTPDNDLVVYWPIHDLWMRPEDRLQHLTIHAAENWMGTAAFGRLSRELWRAGFAFDYVSDRLLAGFSPAPTPGRVVSSGGTSYRTIVVPTTRYMPVGTIEKLISLARGGATVVFDTALPQDVPGWWDLPRRRMMFSGITNSIHLGYANDMPGLVAKVGKGSVHVGDALAILHALGVRREPMVTELGLEFVRRRIGNDSVYFIVNRSDKKLEQWVPLATRSGSAILMDPLTGRVGKAASRTRADGNLEVFLQLERGASVFVWPSSNIPWAIPQWEYFRQAGAPTTLHGRWRIEFTRGGPELPQPLETNTLVSWTELPDPNAHRFAGAAVYTTEFFLPPGAGTNWVIDLGRVCHSARVRVNGIELGTLITEPFVTEPVSLKPGPNRLEMEVVNLSANRVRDMDRRGVQWKIFHDINIVNVNYRPLDASDWPLVDSGLLGPVRLMPMEKFQP